MRKILCVLVVLIFATIACKCEVSVGPNSFCTDGCHNHGCESDEYYRKRECIKCHVEDVCERGNSWRERSKEIRKDEKPPKRRSR